MLKRIEPAENKSYISVESKDKLYIHKGWCTVSVSKCTFRFRVYNFTSSLTWAPTLKLNIIPVLFIGSCLLGVT